MPNAVLIFILLDRIKSNHTGFDFLRGRMVNTYIIFQEGKQEKCAFPHFRDFYICSQQLRNIFEGK